MCSALLCSASSPVTNNPTNSEPTRRRKRRADLKKPVPIALADSHTTGMKLQPAKPTTLPNLVDIDTLAAHLGVSVRHVRRLVTERRIPYVKWGHLLLFDPVAIATWLEGQRVEAARPVVRVAGRR